jgi:hypothetical protein
MKVLWQRPSTSDAAFERSGWLNEEIWSDRGIRIALNSLELRHFRT